MVKISHHKKPFAFTGYVSIAGAVLMLIGAVCWGASGTDLWRALADNQMENYLAQLPKAKLLLVVNTSLWVLGVLFMATGTSLMADSITSKVGLAQMGKVLSRAAVSIAIVSFIIMLSLAIIIPPVDVATLAGWVGARLDDIATMLIVGFCPLCLSIAGRQDWVPAWLSIWGYIAGIAGFLGIISLLTGIVVLGYIIIPIGLGWMIAAGVMLTKVDKSVGNS